MANNNTVKKKKVKMSTGDKVFTVINTIIMILVCIAIVYPLYYVLLASVTDPVVVSSGKFLLYPEAWYTNGYTTTLKYQPLWTGYANTIKYTVVGTLISLVCTIPAGYALSRYDMVGRKPIMFLFTFTMFFSGGMIPMYLTVQQLHIYNTTWAMVLPVAVSAYNLIVCRSFFESGIPVELLEAAKIDGCSDFGFFFKIAIPLSKTIIAVMCLFYATAIPVDNLYGAPLFATHYLRRFGYGREDMVVVSPDVGSVARARSFAMKMGLGLAIVDKRREKANSSEVMNIIGNVEGKTCLLLDDMVDTAGSLCGAAKAIVEVGGAKEVFACASHGVLSGPAIDRINDSVIDELLLLDTIPYPKDKPACDKIHYLPVAPVFAEAINRIYEEMSISSLFE